MARVRGFISSSNKAATSGNWKGYSGDNPTLLEALSWVTDVSALNAKRTDRKSADSLLFCTCAVCGLKGLVRQNTRQHHCLLPAQEGEDGSAEERYQKGLSLVAKGSTVYFYKIVMPVDLYYR